MRWGRWGRWGHRRGSEEATGLSDSCPCARGDGWEHFPPISRLNCVANNVTVRGNRANGMGKMNLVSAGEVISAAQCECGNVQRQLKTQVCNSQRGQSCLRH